MDHATRLPIYQEIEAERNTRVLAFVTGDRPGLETQIAQDAVRPFVTLLDQIGPVPRLSLILDTNGGDTSAAWRLINLLRSFCDELEVIVPTKAMSSGTLMALGANKVVMTKQAALGPIDPTLDNHPLAPIFTVPSGQQFRMGVSAEAVRGYIDEVKKDVSDPAALAAVWTHLSTQIHPLVLGQVFRMGEQIRALARELVKSQVAEEGIQARIVQFLCSDSGSHDYTINRRKAVELGLHVEKPSPSLYGLLSGAAKSYTSEMKTLEPYSPEALLGNQQQKTYALVRGLIESTDESYGFVSDGIVVLNPGPPPTVLDQRTAIGWRKLP